MAPTVGSDKADLDLTLAPNLFLESLEVDGFKSSPEGRFGCTNCSCFSKKCSFTTASFETHTNLQPVEHGMNQSSWISLPLSALIQAGKEVSPGLPHSKAGSEAGSCGSTKSAGSNYSFGSHVSWAGRKGRKRAYEETDVAKPPEPSDTKNCFCCTWCWKQFKKPSDWKGHEESQHAPQTEWICLPEGPEILVSVRDKLVKQCAMCYYPNPSPDHAPHCTKQVGRCFDQPLSNRKFDRRDHLVQHLRNFHCIQHEDPLPPNLNSWKQPLYASGTAPLWDCGFCNERGMSWASRYTHILDHKRLGLDWRLWRRCFCTRGYSGRLQSTLDSLGFGRVFEQPCQRKYLCKMCASGIAFSIPGAALCRHELTGKANWFSFCTRDTHFLIPGKGIPIWCGLCETMVEVDSSNADECSYECMFMAHVDRCHIMQGHACTSWKPLDLISLRHFFGNRIDDVLDDPSSVSDKTWKSYVENFVQGIMRFNRDHDDLPDMSPQPKTFFD